MTQLYFNQFDLDIDYETIAQSFLIFQINHKNGYLSYKDVGILDQLLDMPGTPPLSAAFTGGRGYLLYSSQKTQKTALREKLETLAPQAGMVAEAIEPEIVPEHRLWQLFLNACRGSNHPKYRYSNLSGELFITSPEKEFYHEKDQSRVALQVVVQKSNILALKTVTFTSLRRYEDLIKNEYGREEAAQKQKVLSAPRYLFDSYRSTFRRWLGSQKEAPGELFVKMRPAAMRYRYTNPKKNLIHFFSLRADKYPTTKVCLLNALLFDTFDVQFGRYISFKQVSARQNASHQSFNLRKDNELGLQDIPVQLIDKVGDEEKIEEVRKKLSDNFNLDVPLVEKEASGILNLRFINNRNFYADHGKKDQHMPSTLECPVQNFTFQEYISSGNGYLRKIIEEGRLKYDISCGQLSSFDWKKIKAEGNWHFAVAEKEEEDEALILYLLTITPAGRLVFKTFDAFEVSGPIQELVAGIFAKNSDAKGQPIIDGIVIDGKGNVITIAETNLLSFPALRRVHNRTMQGLNIEDNEFDTQEVRLFTESFIAWVGASSRINDLLTFLQYRKENTTPGSALKKIFKGRGGSDVQQDFVEAFHDTFGFWIQHAVRNQKSVARHSAAMVGIHAAHYGHYILFWANRNMGEAKGHFPRSNVVRRLEAQLGSALLFAPLLDMMNVDFVRVHAPTVLPFPFKLLREYKQMATPPDKGIDFDAFNFD